MRSTHLCDNEQVCAIRVCVSWSIADVSRCKVSPCLYPSAEPFRDISWHRIFIMFLDISIIDIARFSVIHKKFPAQLDQLLDILLKFPLGEFVNTLFFLRAKYITSNHNQAEWRISATLRVLQLSFFLPGSNKSNRDQRIIDEKILQLRKSTRGWKLRLFPLRPISLAPLRISSQSCHAPV